MSPRELAYLTLVELDDALAREAADLAADYRPRGADAVYVAVARRFGTILFGTILVTLDDERRTRAAAIITAVTPVEALTGRPSSP